MAVEAVMAQPLAIAHLLETTSFSSFESVSTGNSSRTALDITKTVATNLDMTKTVVNFQHFYVQKHPMNRRNELVLMHLKNLSSLSTSMYRLWSGLSLPFGNLHFHHSIQCTPCTWLCYVKHVMLYFQKHVILLKIKLLEVSTCMSYLLLSLR